MRKAIEGLESPHPLGLALPALYQQDDFAQRLTSALDEVVAPIFWTLDNLDAYLDPGLAPADFVTWLAGWVGLALDENWPLERQRALVAQAADLYRWQGTARGLATHVALYTGAELDVVDSGGCGWSSTPGGAAPGNGDACVTVRVVAEDPGSIDRQRVEAIVAAAKPAHVRHEVEVIAK
jgi:phage tail-like protein